MSMEECTRRTSIDLDQRGYFVVEEISEDDDVPDGDGGRGGIPSTATLLSSSPPPHHPGSPATIPVNESPSSAVLTSTTFKASSLAYNPVRREFGNISPISEDLSDKEIARGESDDISLLSGGNEEDDLDDTKTSTTAVAGDQTNTSLILQRLNCSSPILAQSPSLRKTPIAVAAMEEAKAAAAAAEELLSSASPSQAQAKGKKLRNFARALDDISDRDEEDDDEEEDDDNVIIMGSKDSDDEDNNMMMDEGCGFEVSEEISGGGQQGVQNSDDDEEKTESFEIDLNNSGGEGGISEEGGGCSPLFPYNSLKPSDSYVEFGTAVANMEKLKLSSQNNDNQGGGGDGNGSSSRSQEQQAERQQRTVWETLSDNIETHMNGGNNAGFVSGPIDHPIHVTKSPEPTELLVMSLEELELIGRYDEEHKLVNP